MAAQAHADITSEDIKALSFVRRSILRKNALIRQLKRQVKELTEEVQALKQSSNTLENNVDIPSHGAAIACTEESFDDTNFTEFPFEDGSADLEFNNTMQDGVLVKQETNDNIRATSFENESQEYLSGGEKRSYDEMADEMYTDASKKPAHAFVPDDGQTFSEQHFPDQTAGEETTTFNEASAAGLEDGQKSDISSCLPKRSCGSSHAEGYQGGQGTPGGKTYHIEATEEQQRRHVVEKPFACPLEGCGYRAATRPALEVHSLSHTGEKPFACSVEGCGYRAAERGRVNIHMRSHTGEKPFACPVEGCRYRAAERGRVNIHMRSHTGEKPFACSVEGCGYRASQRGTVKIHMRSHTGDKPFACPMEGCGFRATEKPKISRHLRTHTGEKPYACPVEGCGYRGAQSGTVKSHIARTHTGDKSFASHVEGR